MVLEEHQKLPWGERMYQTLQQLNQVLNLEAKTQWLTKMLGVQPLGILNICAPWKPLHGWNTWVWTTRHLRAMLPH